MYIIKKKKNFYTHSTGFFQIRAGNLKQKTNKFIDKLSIYNIFQDLPPIEEDAPDQNDGEASDEEVEEFPRNSAEVLGCSTANEKKELTSEAFIGKNKRTSSTYIYYSNFTRVGNKTWFMTKLCAGFKNCLYEVVY